MRTYLAAALACAAVLAAAPLVRGEGPAYTSLVGLAAAAEDDAVHEGRLPAEAVASSRPTPNVPPRGFPAAVPDFPAVSPAAPSVAAHEDFAVRTDAVVVAPPARAVSAWSRLFVLLMPPARSGLPELRASTAAFSGARRPRSRPPAYVPRETEEGVRRGLAEMMALMSAGAEPRAAGPR